MDRYQEVVVRSRRRDVALLVVIGLLVVGCTDDTEEEPTVEAPAPEAFGAEPDLPSMLPEDRDTVPTSLAAVDLLEGRGEEAGPGTLVTVHYAIASWEDGTQLESTWDADEPYTFELGAGRVIEGWEIGVGGSDDVAPMQVGGRRMLTIPPDLAYGDRGAGEDIGPGEALVFVVDLLDVEPVS